MDAELIKLSQNESELFIFEVIKLLLLFIVYTAHVLHYLFASGVRIIAKFAKPYSLYVPDTERFSSLIMNNS